MTHLVDSLAKRAKHLPKDYDIELSLLKCHLLIEELLTELIEIHLKHPHFLQKAQLSFEKKIWIARSLNDFEGDAWLWGALKRLNEARNALAHRLETDQIEKKVDAFNSFIEAQVGAHHGDDYAAPFKLFDWAVFQVFSTLARHAHSDQCVLQTRIYWRGKEWDGSVPPLEPQR